MRAVGLSDLDVAARALIALPRREWDGVACKLINDAHVADKWRKRHGVAHPSGGIGSLYAQAALRPRAATSQCSARYCAALAVLLQALDAWRTRADQDL